MKIRRYFRQPLIQAALLKLPEMAEMPCEIRNFCQAGLLLKLIEPDAEKGLAKNRSDAVVIFTAAKTDTTFHMGGRLGHVSPSGIGFIFDLAPPFQVLQALQEKAIPNPLAEHKVASELIEIHGQCLQAFENALYPLLDSLPQQIQAALAEVAEQTARDDAEPMPEKPPLLMPMVERFYAHILEQAKSFVVPDLSLQPEAGAIYSESQSQRLMFEDWMNLIDKVFQLETQHESILRLLESRFSVFVERDVLNHDNPFGPNVICHSFHYSLQGVSLDNQQRNLVYEIFTRLLDERLSKLYIDLRTLSKPLDALKKTDAPNESLNNLFVGASRFTPLNAPFTPPEQGKALDPADLRPPPPQVTESAPEEKTAGTVAAVSTVGKTLCIPPIPDAFTAFVTLFRYAESQAHKGYREATADADRDAIIAALRKLHTGSQPSYLIAPRLQAGLSKILAETGQEKILTKTEVRENLQILGLMLDAMLADAATPPCVAPYFKRMQIPLLAGSFVDPQLVHGHTHPGRQIFNQLDCLAQAANAQGEIDNAELLQSLEAIFERIASEAGSNPQVFAEASQSLETLTGPLVKAYAARLERLAEVCEGGQRLEHARKLVEREIGARLGGKRVPAVVLTLLDSGWRQLLVLTNLRQGNDNDDWRRQLAVVDLLMNWLDAKAPSNPPSPLNVQGLKNYVSERLFTVGTELAETGRILEKLENQLLGGSGESQAPSYVEVPPIDMSEEQKQEAMRDRLLGFREGEWLKFSSTRGGWIPLRLAWIGQDPVRYVFANRKGIKTLDLDAVKFTQFLDEKRASRMENLDTLSLVERAAKSLMSTLRDRLR